MGDYLYSMDLRSAFYAFIGILTAFVLASALSAVWLIVARKPALNKPDNGSKPIYQDADGTATEESMKAYSDLAPRSLTVLGVLVGLAASAASAVLKTVDVEIVDASAIAVPWTFVAEWVLICLQTALMLFQKPYVGRFETGITVALSTLFLLAQTAVSLYWESISDSTFRTEAWVETALGAAQIVGLIFTIVGSLSIPRRPQIYRAGRVVDAQLTVSAIQRSIFILIARMRQDFSS